MKLRPMMAMLLTAFAASLVVTAASAQQKDKLDRVQQDKFGNVEANVGDAALATRVKHALERSPELTPADVKVETKNGRVLLSGSVQNEEQRKKAIQVASIVDGVTEVKDGMTVK